MHTYSSSDGAAITAEAARYALTRRLLPVLRHHMVVHLQPIGMIYEVLDRKLVAQQPDLVPVREGLAKISQLARLAVSSCLDVVTWLAPDPGVVTNVGAGVEESLDLLRSNFMFRGFTISNQIGDAPGDVLQAAMREVMTAALMAATDAALGAVEVVIMAHGTSHATVVSIETRPGNGAGFTAEMAYRAMQWADVQALAQSHSVGLAHEGAQVRLTFATAA